MLRSIISLQVRSHMSQIGTDTDESELRANIVQKFQQFFGFIVNAQLVDNLIVAQSCVMLYFSYMSRNFTGIKLQCNCSAAVYTYKL